jgi:Putative beta-barrel porin-2, OmpL-like. bbp2
MTGYVVNGWDNLVDTYSSGKTIGARLDWRPVPKILVSEAWLGGRAPTASSLGRRDLSDSTIVYSATNKLSFMANADYSAGALLSPFRLPVHWLGVAGYSRYQFTRILASAVRYEHYDDPSGISTCAACTVLIPDHIDEFTATGEMRFRHFVTRVESRYDSSKPSLFTQDNYRFPTQWTLTLGLMYVIEPQDRFKPYATEFRSN